MSNTRVINRVKQLSLATQSLLGATGIATEGHYSIGQTCAKIADNFKKMSEAVTAVQKSYSDQVTKFTASATESLQKGLAADHAVLQGRVEEATAQANFHNLHLKFLQETGDLFKALADDHNTVFSKVKEVCDDDDMDEDEDMDDDDGWDKRRRANANKSDVPDELTKSIKEITDGLKTVTAAVTKTSTDLGGIKSQIDDLEKRTAVAPGQAANGTSAVTAPGGITLVPRDGDTAISKSTNHSGNGTTIRTDLTYDRNGL